MPMSIEAKRLVLSRVRAMAEELRGHYTGKGTLDTKAADGVFAKLDDLDAVLDKREAEAKESKPCP